MLPPLGTTSFGHMVACQICSEWYMFEKLDATLKMVGTHCEGFSLSARSSKPLARTLCGVGIQLGQSS